MEPQTLADFLLARIAEDEASALRSSGISGVAALLSGIRPSSRWLRTCAAHRRIVEEHDELIWHTGPTGKCRICADNEASDYDGAPLIDWPCPTLRALASVYADHPEYREEWV